MTDLTTQPVRNPSADRTVDVADARRRIHPWRVAVGALLALVTAQIVIFLVTNERFDWPVVAEYLFNPTVLMGLGMSIMLTIVGMVLGSIVSWPPKSPLPGKRWSNSMVPLSETRSVR